MTEKTKYKVQKKIDLTTLSFSKGIVLNVVNKGKFYTTLQRSNGEKVRLANTTWTNCKRLGLVA